MMIPKVSDTSPEIIDVDNVTFGENLDKCQVIYINKKKRLEFILLKRILGY